MARKRNGNRLNPTAMDFVPRTSAKRKATSITQAASSDSLVKIDAVQLFGSNAHTQVAPQSASKSTSQTTAQTSPQSTSENSDDWSDFDEDVLLNDILRGSAGSLQQNQQLRGSFRAFNSKTSQKPAVLLIDTQPAANSSARANRTAGQLPYLPMYPSGAKHGKDTSLSYSVPPREARRIEQTASTASRPCNSCRWPKDSLPVELFEVIASHLARDDVKAMRLVSKEFEHKVCGALFRTAVVPFNTELYDMVIDGKKTTDGHPRPGHKHKGKSKAVDDEPDSWAWRNAIEDREGKLYQGHGVRVFQGFGPHIRRFGMSFEVAEAQLNTPPGKRVLDPIESYHGTYEWPQLAYARFANLNRLEETADETSRMVSAFANLEVVTEVALSMRNGLGWLEGPDKSFRARLFPKQGPVFETSYESRTHETRAARDIMTCLRQGLQKVGLSPACKELTLERQALGKPLEKLQGLQGSSLAKTQLWPTLDSGIAGFPRAAPASSDSSPSADRFHVLSFNGDLFAKMVVVELNPNDLKKEQKEWLLETEWAQRAFLESYILAVMDNPIVFSRVTTLNLAAISSGLLPMISREMFWDALPSLANVKLHVSPDWRTVYKDDAGCADTVFHNPTVAVRGFHDLLRDQVACRKHIKSLQIGWADGGEHAEGMYARNANVLPAPISLLEQSVVTNPTGQLLFPHVVHLTLSNCWVSPLTLERVVRGHADQALQKLTLDSVSLTSLPNTSHAAQQAQALAAPALNAQLQNLAAMGAAHGQVYQQALAQQHAAMAQQFQLHMQHVQQLFNNNNANNNPAPGGLPPAGFPAPPQMPNAWWAAGANANQQPPPLQPHHTNINNNLNPTHWVDGHRRGSWPDLLNKISPGPIFTDYLPAPPPWEPQHPPRPATSLQAIELISCGYIYLDHNDTLEQNSLLLTLGSVGIHARSRERDTEMTPWFRARWAALKPYMLETSDKFTGRILQGMPHRELDALRFAWGMREGWADAEKAEEAEYDGYKPGGTGRVSGIIEKGMLMMQHLTPGAGGTSSTFS